LQKEEDPSQQGTAKQVRKITDVQNLASWMCQQMQGTDLQLKKFCHKPQLAKRTAFTGSLLLHLFVIFSTERKINDQPEGSRFLQSNFRSVAMTQKESGTILASSQRSSQLSSQFFFSMNLLASSPPRSEKR
jgi:hypothetical protein